MMLKLCAQYQQKEQIAKLRGEWIPCNPRDWRNGFETTVNVGLGTGSKDQLVGHLMALSQQQQIGLQVGTCDPRNVYEGQKELAKAMGFKSPDKFFTDPSKAPPRPPQPGPFEIEQMKAQLKAQTDQQAKQSEMQLESQRMQMQAQVDTHRQQVEAQQKTLELQQQRELEQMKIQAQMQLEQFKAQMTQETAVIIAKINAEAKIDAAQLAANTVMTPEQDAASDAAVDDEGTNEQP